MDMNFLVALLERYQVPYAEWPEGQLDKLQIEFMENKAALIELDGTLKRLVTLFIVEILSPDKKEVLVNRISNAQYLETAWVVEYGDVFFDFEEECLEIVGMLELLGVPLPEVLAVSDGISECPTVTFDQRSWNTPGLDIVNVAVTTQVCISVEAYDPTGYVNPENGMVSSWIKK